MLLPWLAVLAVVLLLDALHLGVLATAVAVTWLVYCVWTWVRPERATGPAEDPADPAARRVEAQYR
ncbi:hypothetical protein Phou_088540 [Phytohabitans houttuyneae]|uniref:Uncharacterized protein n=1 Tax=Phytohabitans houttuyneae TaxID=1076126 RepID=A0A6V8KLD7_9ACTN|nr:hypothetical protein Phou_088540 [Phytohabitans houttuyneae]